MGQIARERAWRERNEEEGAVTLHVTLDWLVRVEGTTDEAEAREIVAGYMRDQSDLAESLEIDTPDEDDWELTIVLYPDDVDVPEDTGLAAAWSTYARTPAEFRQGAGWCGVVAEHVEHGSCPGVSGVRAARPDPRDSWPVDHEAGE
jgi:hypothetical protein